MTVPKLTDALPDIFALASKKQKMTPARFLAMALLGSVCFLLNVYHGADLICVALMQRVRRARQSLSVVFRR